MIASDLYLEQADTRAAANDRSMEAEARAILSAAVAAPGFGNAWLELAASYRGDELQLPGRGNGFQAR